MKTVTVQFVTLVVTNMRRKSKDTPLMSLNKIPLLTILPKIAYNHKKAPRSIEIVLGAC